MPEMESIKKLSAQQLANVETPVDPLEAQRRIAEERHRVLADPLARHQTYVESREEKLLGPLNAQERVLEARREYLQAPANGLSFNGLTQGESAQDAFIRSARSRTGYTLQEESTLLSSVNASATKEVIPQEISKDSLFPPVPPKRMHENDEPEKFL